MSVIRWPHAPLSRVAMGTLLVSSLVAVWALVGALRMGDVTAVNPTNGAAQPAFAPASKRAASDIESAVRRDPFAPDRSAPEQRYRIPGEAADEQAAADAPEPVLLGTAVSDAAHSFATIRVGDGNAVILRIGDHIATYTVTAIARGRVTFRTPSGTLLQVNESKP